MRVTDTLFFYLDVICLRCSVLYAGTCHRHRTVKLYISLHLHYCGKLATLWARHPAVIHPASKTTESWLTDMNSQLHEITETEARDALI